MPGTVLFGIDVETASENSVAFAEHGGRLFRELGVPVTWFLTGATLERYPDVFREVDRGGLIELQAHTYGHILLKTVLMRIPDGLTVHDSTGWHVQRGAPVEEVDGDLARCQKVFQAVLGRRAAALTTPWAYYRGLGDRPDLLEIVAAHGFRALRSFGRNQDDSLPVPLDWQPFFYEPQGFPDILECMIHDYQDDSYWKELARSSEGGDYLQHLKKVVDRTAAEDLTLSLCSHDHSWATKEIRNEKQGWMRSILEYALGLNVRFLTISEYYREMHDRLSSCKE